MKVVMASLPVALATVKYTSFYGVNKPAAEEFGSTALPKLFDDFGTVGESSEMPDVFFEMVPYMTGTVSEPICFGNCTAEKLAFCVIDIANSDSRAHHDKITPQDAIVNWQICHSEGHSFHTCHQQVDIDQSEVDSCFFEESRIQQLMQAGIDRAQNVTCTPWKEVNGKQIGSCAENSEYTYDSVKKAICAADPSMTACSSVLV